MLSIIIAGIVWVAIPILFAIAVASAILNELDAEERRNAHRKYMLDAVNSSNMNIEDKAEVVCKFVNCRRK